MCLKKVVVHLENGVKITLRRLDKAKTDEVYLKYPSLFEPPHSAAVFLYWATISFKRSRFHAVCFDFAVPLILNLLGRDPKKAMDHFEGFIVGQTVVPCWQNPSSNDERTRERLKKAITENMPPTLIALFGG